ncbi:hypothetical protein HYQ44_014153 [Verticillium longisporum]|nr:hypothetical protein HYQ44_014153 [Verticillium longisporum]
MPRKTDGAFRVWIRGEGGGSYLLEIARIHLSTKTLSVTPEPWPVQPDGVPDFTVALPTVIVTSFFWQLASLT